MMNDYRWMLVLPPIGASRSQGLAIVKAFQQELADSVMLYDTKDALAKIQSVLKSEDSGLCLEWLNHQFVVKVLEEKVRFVLCLSMAPIDPYYLRILRQHQVVCVHWMYDDLHFADYWRGVLSGYDTVFASQSSEIQRECKEQNVDFHFLPLAASISVSGSGLLWNARSLDVVFVGERSPYRVHLLEVLAAAGLSVGIQGENWDLESGFLARSVYALSAGSGDVDIDLYRQGRIALHLPLGQAAGLGAEMSVPANVWNSIALGAYPMISSAFASGISMDGLIYHEFQTETELLALCMTLRQSGVSSDTILANQKAIQRTHNMNHRVRQLMDAMDD